MSAETEKQEVYEQKLEHEGQPQPEDQHDDEEKPREEHENHQDKYEDDRESSRRGSDVCDKRGERW